VPSIIMQGTSVTVFPLHQISGHLHCFSTGQMEHHHNETNV
jgi:hypothetical protein